MKILNFLKQIFLCRCKAQNINKGMVSNPYSYDMQKEEALKDFMVGMVKKLENLNLYDYCEFKFGNFRGAARCISIKNHSKTKTRGIEVEFYKQKSTDEKVAFKDKKSYFYYTTNTSYFKAYDIVVVVEKIIQILLLLENTQHLRAWSYYLNDRERDLEERWLKELQKIKENRKNQEQGV